LQQFFAFDVVWCKKMHEIMNPQLCAFSLRPRHCEDTFQGPLPFQSFI